MVMLWDEAGRVAPVGYRDAGRDLRAATAVAWSDGVTYVLARAVPVVVHVARREGHRRWTWRFSDVGQYVGCPAR